MHRLRTLTLALVAGAVFLALAGPAMASGGGRGDGAVYTLTNSASGNAVAVFERDRDGSLTRSRDGPDRRERHRRGPRFPGCADPRRRPALRGQRGRQHDLSAAGRPPRQGAARRRRPVRRRQADQRHGARQVRLRPERRERHDAGQHPRLPGAVGQARSAAGLDPSAEYRRARPGAGRVQPERPPAGRDREGDEHDRHLQGAARLRERPERAALGRHDPVRLRLRQARAPDRLRGLRRRSRRERGLVLLRVGWRHDRADLGEREDHGDGRAAGSS